MDFKRLLRNNRGLSLVEVLVTMFIFLFVAGAIYTLTIVGNDIWMANKTRIELQQELRKGMDWMIYELRAAGPSSILDVPADGSWYSSITFKTPSGVSSGSISWNATSVQFILGGTNGQQLQRIFGGSTKLLASNITAVQFRRQVASSDILEVSLQAQNTAPGSAALSSDLDFEVQLRN